MSAPQILDEDDCIAQVPCRTGNWRAYAQTDFILYEFTSIDSTLPAADVTLDIFAEYPHIFLVIHAHKGQEPHLESCERDGYADVQAKLYQVYDAPQEVTECGTYDGLTTIIDKTKSLHSAT